MSQQDELERSILKRLCEIALREGVEEARIDKVVNNETLRPEQKRIAVSRMAGRSLDFDITHNWTQIDSDGVDFCTHCGILRRKDRMVRPCPGPVEVGLRQESADDGLLGDGFLEYHREVVSQVLGVSSELLKDAKE